MNHIPADPDLFDRAVAGDRVAMGESLYSQMSWLEQYIRGRLPDRIDPIVTVEDLIQDVLAVAAVKISAWQGPRESFRLWLERVADNRIRQMVEWHSAAKRRGVRESLTMSDQEMHSWLEEVHSDGPTPEQTARHNEASERLRQAVRDLPIEQRLAVSNHCLDGLSLEMTAAVMKQTVPSVRGLLYRAKRSLQATMGPASRWFSSR